MEAVESFEHLAENVSNEVFWDFTQVVVYKVDHGPSVHELYEHEQRLSVIIGEKVTSEIV